MPAKKLTFAQAMERLDAISKQLGQPNLPLEEAMDLFKEGLQLTKQCENQLAAFEKEMNQLIVQDQESTE